MRPDPVVMLSPALDHDLGFEAISEPLHGQALIAEFAMEAFRHAVFSGPFPLRR